jgi:hypothetical protein
VRKTPLSRFTPLRPKRPTKRWQRPEEDKVSPELAAYIFARDKMCIAFRVEGPSHVCRTRFGDPHPPLDVKLLTIDHVKTEARMGKRAEPTKRNLVAACGWANNEGWCSANRQAERDYLEGVEDD